MKQSEYNLQAEKIFEKDKNLDNLVIKIRDYLNDYFSHKHISYKACSLIESRFIPSEIAFKIGMKSCGAITNIVTDMLRHLGYEVKKVHGTSLQLRDHSWVKVRLPETSDWKSYDITQKDCRTTKDHIELADCYDWMEIADQLIGAHLANIKSNSKNRKENPKL